MRAIAMLAFALFAANAAHAQDCTLKQITSLPMEPGGYGQAVVPVAVGETPAKMDIALGSDLSWISPGLAERAGLRIQSLSGTHSRNPALYYTGFYLGTGEHAKSFVTIPLMTIGAQQVTYTEFLVDPNIGNDAKSDGAIGGDIWSHFDLDFDFANRKLNLFSPDHCPGKVVYWAPAYTDAEAIAVSGHALVVRMSLDGRDVDATIEPGAPQTTMSFNATRTAFGLDANSPGVETVPSTGGRPLYRTHFKKLSLSGISIEDPQIYLVSDPVAEQKQKDQIAAKLQSYEGNGPDHPVQLIVGMDVLRRLHLYVALKEKKIYATAADAH